MRIIICKSGNGWMILKNNQRFPISDGLEVERGTETFNSLDRAISYIRKELKSWHPINHPQTLK